MKREEILKAYEASPEAVINLVNSLTATIFEQSEQITALQERIKVLEDQFHKNSSNSSKPLQPTDFLSPKVSVKKGLIIGRVLAKG